MKTHSDYTLSIKDLHAHPYADELTRALNELLVSGVTVTATTDYEMIEVTRFGDTEASYVPGIATKSWKVSGSKAPEPEPYTGTVPVITKPKRGPIDLG